MSEIKLDDPNDARIVARALGESVRLLRDEGAPQRLVFSPADADRAQAEAAFGELFQLADQLAQLRL